MVRGLAAAESVLTRIDPLDLSSLPEPALQRTRDLFGVDATPESSVLQMLRDVRAGGDSAVRRYASLLDDADLDTLEVPEAELEAAWDDTPDDLKQALQLAARRITEFHEATLPRDWVDLSGGLGELVRPLERVGLYAPGGTAAYPSTVLMTAIPARVAGVSEVVLATPRRGQEPLNSTVLAAARIAGVDAVYQVGGVPAIGALAYGTETIRKVDKICGPGNVFVAYAKRMVQGQVDIDGVFGPTETILLADESANPVFCAADLIAQAEHDPMASAILVTDSQNLIYTVEAELDGQITGNPRAETIRQSLERQGCIVLVDDFTEAIAVANHIAPEHLCLMVANPWAWAGQVRNAGGLFLGEFSPEVMGDYIAGPSHVMPTGGTARFSSALSVHHFLRTMPVVGLSLQRFTDLGAAAVRIAEAEGLPGHAGAVQARLDHIAAMQTR
ncbi:Histidinol dehydrogenase [Geodia barretti]|uniref:Histidinol dehydrogenase n=3 Tax=Geodia barretti TaxID=519541 RepID=A0AA35RWD1_GEOBA|nr:Histidinol dehydrogenase [Geodia barretti]